jgi:hypothetical protein
MRGELADILPATARETVYSKLTSAKIGANAPPVPRSIPTRSRGALLPERFFAFAVPAGLLKSAA